MKCALVLALAAWHAAEALGADEMVAATVGNEAILVGEVHTLLNAAIGGRELGSSAKAMLEARVLEEIVARRLVMAYAGRMGRTVGTSEIERRWQRLQRETGPNADGEAVDADQLRRQAAWQAQWQHLIDRYATDARLAEHFRANRRDFDGTELSVRHVLLAADDLVAALATAKRLRERILRGQTTFEQVVSEYSTGPSADRGGRVGRIGRHGPMVESFTAAAFALEPGEISPPVVTPFGVHLIQCEEVHPGTRQLADVVEQVHEALGRELLERLADLERRHTPVRYSGATAHLDPETKTLIRAEP